MAPALSVVAVWRAVEFLLRLNYQRFEGALSERYACLEAAASVIEIRTVALRSLDGSYAKTSSEVSPRAPESTRLLQVRIFEHAARSMQQRLRTGDRARDTLGVVLLVHGLSPSGNRDARMEAVARALASLGFTAVIPDFVEFRECRMGQQTLDEIAWAVVAVAKAFHQESISLFAACVAAGYTLCAVLGSGDHIRQRVRTIMCIGPYAEVEAMVWCAMSSDSADDYGRNAIFYNFLQYSSLISDIEHAGNAANGPGWMSQLLHALRLALEDSHFLRGSTEAAMLPKYFKELRDQVPHSFDTANDASEDASSTRTSHVQRVFERFQADKEFRELHTKAMLSHPAVQKLIASCQPIRVVSREPIDFPILLLHGECDNIVPCRESRRLFCAMMHNKLCTVKPLIEITSLLNHGDRQRLNWFTDTPQIIRLIRLFAQFFTWAAQPRISVPQSHSSSAKNRTESRLLQPRIIRSR